MICDNMLKGTINLATVPNPDDDNNEFVVTNFVDDPVLSLAHAVTIVSGQFLATARPGIPGQTLDSLHKSLSILPGGYGYKLLPGRGLDNDPISSHCA